MARSIFSILTEAPPQTARTLPGVTSYTPAAAFLWENKETLIKSSPVRAGGKERRVVSYQAETPFDTIEGSHEYVALLADALSEARRDVEAELSAAEREGADRRKEALLLVAYNLAKLHLHFTTSRRILNDLRSLRRLLLAERNASSEEEPKVSTAGRIL
jgi:hypothetical protein